MKRLDCELEEVVTKLKTPVPVSCKYSLSLDSRGLLQPAARKGDNIDRQEHREHET